MQSKTIGSECLIDMKKFQYIETMLQHKKNDHFWIYYCIHDIEKKEKDFLKNIFTVDFAYVWSLAYFNIILNSINAAASTSIISL